MLGNAMLRVLVASPDIATSGSARSAAGLKALPEALRPLVHTGVDVENPDALASLLGRVRPQVVINCVGLVKQLAESNDPLAALPINATLPHRLSRLCALVGARLVHFSTDCVYAGTRGGYAEADAPDAQDLYGLSKLLGEVTQDGYAHANSFSGDVFVMGNETDDWSFQGREVTGSNNGGDWFKLDLSEFFGFMQGSFTH